LVSDLVAPNERLAVEIFQGSEGAGGEKAGTYILNSTFHTPFFIPAGRAAREGGEMIVGRELQEARMEVDGIAATLQDHAAEIVGL
jgi:hypothetical protein